MNVSYRKNAIIVGVLFLMGFLGVPSLTLLNPVLKAPDVLASVAVNKATFLTGAILLAFMAFACAGIALAMFPVLKRFSVGLAIGSVGFRILEAALFLVGVLCLLALVPISQVYAASGASGTSDVSGYIAAAAALVGVNDMAENVLGLLSWNIGALMYYYVFFKAKLIPRWLSAWGLAGVILSMVSVLLVAYGVSQPSSGLQVAMTAPVGLQELVLAVWLIARGYNKSAFQAEVA